MAELRKILFLAFLMIFIHAIGVKCRPLKYDSNELVSDGLDHVQEDKSFSSLLLIDAACEQMYGFLPCSESPGGHLFLVLVYEYLLFHGESYIASGGERIFKILGPGFFGATAFHVLGSLPEATILLASGILNTKELAQEYVVTGVGLLAGSTILLLTVIWGTCVLVACQDLSSKSSSGPSTSSARSKDRFLQISSKFSGHGLVTDLETCYTARIMLLSVIPFAIIQIPRIFYYFFSSAEEFFLILSLLVSVAFLLIYFFYQFLQPWIQLRRLEYTKHEHLIVDVLKRVQNHTMEKLLNEDGAPNISAIKTLFEKADHDEDNLISFFEFQEFLRSLSFAKSDRRQDRTMEELMREFDINKDQKITEDEFVNCIMKWLNETKQAIDKRYHSVRSLKDMYTVLQPWIQKKREEREMMKHIMSEIFNYSQSSRIGSLLTEDGSPDIPAIRRLFESIDHDKDHLISQSELKELINNIKFGEIHYDLDESLAKTMEELDLDGDHMINEEELVTGLTKWLHRTTRSVPNSEAGEDETYLQKWEQTDKLLNETIDDSPLAWIKGIILLVIGILILGVLAEPLIKSVQSFSTSARLSPFFISFILVPLATNARVAISAIKETRLKKERTTSLTFSEIYSGVFMNNILGFTVLLSLIYFRGFTWNFSAEVLIVLIVCIVMGCFASSRSIYPVWTAPLAYMLYSLSLIMVYLLGNFSRTF